MTEPAIVTELARLDALWNDHTQGDWVAAVRINATEWEAKLDLANAVDRTAHNGNFDMHVVLIEQPDKPSDLIPALTGCGPGSKANAELIAALHNAYPALREQLREMAAEIAEARARKEAYTQVNPMGGPAVVFRAMAERIEAGEPFYDVLADYKFTTEDRLAAVSANAERWKWARDRLAIEDVERMADEVPLGSMNILPEESAKTDKACDAARSFDLMAELKKRLTPDAARAASEGNEGKGA